MRQLRLQSHSGFYYRRIAFRHAFVGLEGVVVGTSNKVPDDLCMNGVQRTRLEPFVEAMEARCPVTTMSSVHDWRQKTCLSRCLNFGPPKTTGTQYQRARYCRSSADHYKFLSHQVLANSRLHSIATSHEDLLGVDGGPGPRFYFLDRCFLRSTMPHHMPRGVIARRSFLSRCYCPARGIRHRL
ncbi:hypothetical protein EDB19DRAFT_848705 [Suillus lakei]|nr:hypothetical protein EDB19DRAFT_848705 [Suillus lakei]